MNGHEANGSICQYELEPYIFPKLIDNELGPEEFPSIPTNYTYILNGSTDENFKRWINFVLRDDSQGVPLTQVILHYYCTGPPPELQLSDESNLATPPKTPSCGKDATRQRLSFDYNYAVKRILLSVKHKGGQFYLSEVHFLIKPVSGKP